MFFTNSGTEAIEGAVKIAKKYHFLKHNNHNGEIIAMKKSFHGRSMGALSVTGKAAYQKPFAPMLAHVKFAVQFSWKQYKERAEFILPLITSSKEFESSVMRTKF